MLAFFDMALCCELRVIDVFIGGAARGAGEVASNVETEMLETGQVRDAERELMMLRICFGRRRRSGGRRGKSSPLPTNRLTSHYC